MQHLHSWSEIPLGMMMLAASQTQVIVLTVVIFASSLAYIIWLIKRKL